MDILQRVMMSLGIVGWLCSIAGCASSPASLAPARVDRVPVGTYHVVVSEDRTGIQRYQAVLLEKDPASVVLEGPTVERGTATGAGDYQAGMRPGFVVYEIRGSSGAVHGYLLASPGARVRVWERPGRENAVVVTVTDVSSGPEMGGAGGGGAM
jgi:hypothetical protein